MCVKSGTYGRGRGRVNDAIYHQRCSYPGSINRRMGIVLRGFRWEARILLWQRSNIQQLAWHGHVGSDPRKGPHCRLARDSEFRAKQTIKGKEMELLSHACWTVRHRCLNEKGQPLDDLMKGRSSTSRSKFDNEWWLSGARNALPHLGRCLRGNELVRAVSCVPRRKSKIGRRQPKAGLLETLLIVIGTRSTSSSFHILRRKAPLHRT